MSGYPSHGAVGSRPLAAAGAGSGALQPADGEPANDAATVALDLANAKREDQERTRAYIQRFGAHSEDDEATGTDRHGGAQPNPTSSWSYAPGETSIAAVTQNGADHGREHSAAQQVTFHVGPDEDAEEIELARVHGQATHPRDWSPASGEHVPMVASGVQPHLASRRSSVGRLRRSASSAVLDLTRVTDPDLRAYLDPSHPHVPSSELEKWSDAKLAELVKTLRSENFPRILDQAEMDGVQERAESLTFSHVSVTNASGAARLSDVSGYLVPGEVVGIIAAPDAGASTLLDLLAGVPMPPDHKVQGNLRYAGRVPDERYRSTVGYVSQSDMHMPLLTVEETLWFSARLRLPARITDRMVRFRVQTVMALLQLTHVSNSYVGDDFVKGISGGQKRRLSVGVELVAGHSVLLGDLVTNGLDSATAFDLIHTFRQMTTAGLSIACSVVQAGPEMFQLFHRIILMSKGSVIYSGPPSLAEAYFRSIGFRRPKQKSTPQFLEELSAEPEAFFKPLIARSLGPGASAPGDRDSRLGVLNGGTAPSKPQPPRRAYSSDAGVDLTSQFRADSKWLPAAKSKKFYAEPQFSLHVQQPQEQPGAGATNGAQREAAAPPPMPLNKARVAAWQQLNQAYQSSIWYVDVRESVTELNTLAAANATTNHHPSNARPGHAPTNAVADRRSADTHGAQDLLGSSTTTTKSSLFGTYNSSFVVQLRENFLRQARNFYRAQSTWLYVWIQALMLGSIFWQDELDASPTGVRNRLGLYFYLIAYCTFNSFAILPIVLGQRSLLYAQSAHHFFSPAAYFLTLFAVQAVVFTVELLIFLIPIWGLSDLAGFPLSGAFWFCFLVLVTATLAARFFITFLCYAFPGDIAATTTLTVCFYVFALLAGEFIPKFLAPPGWSWAYNLSYMYWLLKALVLQDPVDPVLAKNLTGWVAGEESQWTSWEHGLYFAIAFGVAALVTMTFVSWQRAAMPSAADFLSATLSTHKDEDMVADTDETIDAQEAEVAQAIQLLAQTEKDRESRTPREAYLEFSDLSYWVTLPSGEEKQLLDKVFGFVRPGRLVALIGKSGAGKSTLLDVLAGKKTGGRIEGKILVNGKPKDDRLFYQYAGYVEQFDSFAPLNTVRETLLFSARLRLAPTLTLVELNAKVDRVLDILNLRPSEGSIVGFPGMGGISMELRKKLAIAVEVIAEPVLLFLDEPTTGLDSASAANVMRTIRSLASAITVICTIHQPPSELVANFQDTLLLDDGGKPVFFGPIEELPRFLAYAGLPPIVPGRNVSDYALEVISKRANPHGGEANSQDDQGAAAGRQLEEGHARALQPLSEIFLSSDFAKEVKAALANGIVPADQAEALHRMLTVPRPTAGFMLQLRELTERFWQTSIRHRDSLFVRYFFALLFGFIVGTVFERVGHTQSEGPKKLSIIFFTVGHFQFSSSSFFPAIFMNRVLYFREHTGSRMYSALAYFLARFLGDLPHILGEVFLTTLLVYFVSGLSNDSHSQRYGYFLWANVILRSTAIFMTQLVASVIAAPDFAFSVLATIMYLQFALTGFFIPENQIRHWWLWLSDLNFLKYGLQFLSITEYRDQPFTCDPLGQDAATMVPITPDEAAAYSVCRGPIQTFPAPDGSGGLVKCHYSCGFDLLEEFGVKRTVEWQVESFVILHCFLIFFAATGFLALRYINHIKR